MSTRRQFLGQVSSASVAAWGTLFHLRLSSAALPHSTSADDVISTDSPDQWKSFGRIHLQKLKDSVVIQDGFVLESHTWQDCSFSFTARAPQDVEEVQIWAGIKCRDRDARYVFALRGGDNDHMYLARYGPDGAARFLGIAPLDFHPVPGEWYHLRAITRGKRILIYVKDEPLPRINVVDEEASWNEGSVSLGGGWLPAEFRDVTVSALSDTQAAEIDGLGDKLWMPATLDKHQKRLSQRSTYHSVQIAPFDRPRMEFSLDGQWLFLPEQELQSGVEPQSLAADDTFWHVMDVPHFWTPTLSWLHDEIGFSYLKGLSASKGISDKLYAKEMDRLDSYTFDWRKTRGAWYRHHIELPQLPHDRRLELCFDAIAKVSDVWLNGQKVGSHIGMFGELRCDITHAAHAGQNVLAVHVHGEPDRSAGSNTVMGVAVTVEVTDEMLHSLPHGMYPNNASGIWQPVSLIVTNTLYIDDVQTKPKLDGLDMVIAVTGDGSEIATAELKYRIVSVKNQDVLYTSAAPHKIQINGKSATVPIATPELKPLHWTPWEPNLYHLELSLTAAGRIVDQRQITIGFRTFAVQKNQLLLNGKPFWLRGANHFPHALRPNDSALARHFMQLAKDGNVAVTRSHTAPFTKAWLDAADEVGMAVSFEGTWPWLMLEGPPPSQELLDQWKQEFLALIRKYRNHPSIILWTVNNEMKFPVFDRNKPEQLQRKWEIVSDVVRGMRELDPTRPIVCDSSYARKEVGAEYEDLIRPHHFDDGDIDDAHRYYGWYDPSFFHFFNGEFGKHTAYPGRPLISQEMSTGYPRNDDGHPVRFYLFQHHTPQSLVGLDAYENRDPAIFLERQAFMTKELAEVIRRTNRDDCSGILHFAYVSWFKDAWNNATIRPFTSYDALRTALQPVLISAELYGRHFYAGSKNNIRVCIANDSTDCRSLPGGNISWEVRSGSQTLARGSKAVSSIPYYTNSWTEISLAMPTDLSPQKLKAALVLRYEVQGLSASENQYDIVIATKTWSTKRGSRSIALLGGSHSSRYPQLLPGNRTIHALAEAQDNDVVIIPDAEQTLANTKLASELLSFVNSGGHVLLSRAGASLPRLFPDQVKLFRPCGGEIVTMHVPESIAFQGLDPLELSWFNMGPGVVPRACRGTYQLHTGRTDVTMLAEVTDIHGYLNHPGDLEKIYGTPLAELRIGKGKVLASEMTLEEAVDDPIADKLLSNLVTALMK